MTQTRKMELRRHTIVATKFALTTYATLGLASLFAPSDLLSCAFVGLITLQPNLLRGLKASLVQVQATALATAVTILAAFALRHDLATSTSFLQVALAAGVTVFLSLRHFDGDVAMSGVFTVLYLSIMPSVLGQSFWETIHVRYLTILIGIAASTVFNYGTSLLRHKDRLYLNVLAISTRLKEILLELEEHLTVVDSDPPVDMLKAHLADFRGVFDRLHRFQVDIEELEVERERLPVPTRRLMGAHDGRLCRSMANRLNVVAHYTWNMVLNLIQYRVDEGFYQELMQAFSRNVLAFRRAHRALEAVRWPDTGPGAGSSEEILSRVAGLVERLGRSRKDPSVMASLTLMSDMVHLEMNIVEYARYVQRYVTAKSGATPRPGGQAEPGDGVT